MSLYAEKLLSLFVLPLGAFLALLALALLFLALRRRRLAGLALLVALVGLWLASTTAVSDLLQSSLESRFLPGEVARAPTADAIVVIGGAVSPPRPPWFRVGLTDASDRVLHAARLYRAKRAPKIVVSGGAISWMTSGGAEAYPIASLLVEWGVPRSAILLETKSRNTHENAVDTHALLEREGLHSVLLVTSALHMLRAYETFLKAGVDALPSPTDYRVADDQPRTVLRWLPDAEALAGTTAAVREYLGIAWYRLNGWM